MTKTLTLGFFASLFCLTSATQAYAAANRFAPASGCSGYPGPGQAFLWTGTNGTGTCYLLQMENISGDSWTSWDATTGFPNDVIQSAMPGPGVTLVMFWHNFNTKDNGATLSVSSGYWYPDMGSWKNQVSAVRLQTFAANSCTGSDGRLVVFTDPVYSGDCTEFRITGQGSCWAKPVDMGFRNDTVSSVFNTGSIYATLWVGANFSLGSFFVDACEGYPYMNQNGFGYEDIISSAGLSFLCLR